MKQIFPALLVGALCVAPVAVNAAADSKAEVAVKPWSAIEKLFARPSFMQMQLSPDGKSMAVLVPVNDRRNLAVIDLEGKAIKVLTNLKEIDVARFFWVNNDRLIFTQGDALAGSGEPQNWGGVVAVNKDGTELRRFKSGHSLVGVLSDGSDNVLMVNNDRSSKALDLYVVNSKTEKSTLKTFDNPATPGVIVSFLPDSKGEARLAYLVDDKRTLTMTKIYHRSSREQGWKLIKEFEEGQEGEWDVLGLDSDDKTAFVAVRGVDSKFALHTLDMETQVLGEKLLAHDLVDVGGGNADLIHAASGKVIGLALDAEKPEIYWFDRAWAKLSEQVDATLKGRINYLAGDLDGRIAIYSTSDVDQGSYYLLDTKTLKMEEVAQAAPWLDADKTSPMRPVQYKARDGMTIPAYLTLPKGKAEKMLPLVVNIHGGPFGVRDSWGWNPEVQFLASRGYAVLQPNYRGSGGYGWKHLRSGWKQWGLAMQDDITDGVNWLVNSGVVDKNRICIYGGSYGGYATLMGLVKDPDLYKCGVDIVGVSDIEMKFDVQWSDYARSNYVKHGAMAAFVGDPKTDQAQLKMTSPLQNADKFKAPVFIAHGALDRRVPLVHAERMRDALKAHGKAYEWLVIDDEGHGFFKMENVKLFYPAVEAFLKKYIGS
ncbi:peptidase S9 [Chitinimonas prasina]|uniref:Peptidase S9 n=1 Tax=Chitinimonas prasina TaxID=1434937 RepID=A0ABQ5YEG2_9NEIS|nr:S9 family peptidase [Chitinimonas prasina]GLR11725.1 peptidase S9 [Chitinimonas prasina]